MLKDIKYRGINTESNGYDATAGQLAVAHNVVNDRGYLEPIVPPGVEIGYDTHSLSGYKCVFKHEMLSGVVNYIFYKPTGDFVDDDFNDDFMNSDLASLVFLGANPGAGDQAQEVTWQTGSPVRTSITTEGNLYEITAVGNTLCVLTAAGMDYFVWKSVNGSFAYQELGTIIPNVSLQFALKEYEFESGTKNLPEQISVVTEGHGGVSFEATIPESKRAALSDAIYGSVNEVVSEATDAGCAGDPFLVRYAIRLFDGNLTKHSSPVYMYASNIAEIEPYVSLLRNGADVDPDTDYYREFRVVYIASRLNFKYLGFDGTLDDWKDIIDGVEIYITKPKSRIDQSKEIESFICASDHASRAPINPGWVQLHTYSSCVSNLVQDTYNIEDLNTLNERRHPSGGTFYPEKIFANMVNFPRFETNPEEAPLFYLVQKVSLNDLPSYSSDFAEIDMGYALKNLEVQPVMTDDYHSHDTLIPGGSYSYNQRINLYGINRKVWFDQKPETFFQFFNSAGTSSTARIYVKIELDGVAKWIASEPTTMDDSILSRIRYFYYADPQAIEAYVLKGTSTAYSLQLKRHPLLNGAYWFSLNAKTSSSGSAKTTSEVVIAEPNKVYTSEVGDPFYFPIGGINTIGTGKIMALASNVRAISQGQFGEFPLYVFTETGIWMLEVDDKGLYKAKQPMSLDRVLPGSKVTSMDNAVAYVTERGLMLVSGSETRCISEVLDGKFIAMPDILGGFAPSVNWETFKTGISCAYDSDNRRLHVYNPDYLWHYVFSVRSGEWTTMSDLVYLRDTINGRYVDTQLGLLDFNAEAPDTAQVQTILTRPISFESDAYKRMRDNIQRGDLDGLRMEGKSVAVLAQGSNDLLTWHDISAVAGHYRMIRKSGTPYKWFRWKIVINCMPRDYKLHGLTADVEVTGNNKLR